MELNGHSELSRLAERGNRLAYAALAAGILQFFPPALILAIVLGHLAVRDLRRAGLGHLKIARTALVLGYLGLAIELYLPLLILNYRP